VKRRRALLESNPPRNIRSQTHPDDEARGEALIRLRRTLPRSASAIRTAFLPAIACSSLCMPDNVLERERLLREEIERELPEFVKACAASAHFVIMHQDAFAPGLGEQRALPPRKSHQVRGLSAKKVRIVPSARRPS